MMKTHRKEKNSIFWNRGITRLCFCWTTFGFVVLLDIGNESITPLLMLIFLDHCDSCTYILTSLLKIKRWKNEHLRPKMWSRPRQPLLHSHNKNEAHVHLKKQQQYFTDSLHINQTLMMTQRLLSHFKPPLYSSEATASLLVLFPTFPPIFHLNFSANWWERIR